MTLPGLSYRSTACSGGALKQQKFIPRSSGDQKSKTQQGRAPSEVSSRGSFLVSSSFWGLQVFLCISPVSIFYLHMTLFSLGLLSYKDTCPEI